MQTRESNIKFQTTNVEEEKCSQLENNGAEAELERKYCMNIAISLKTLKE